MEKMAPDYSSILKSIDDNIRINKRALALKELQKLAANNIPFHHLAKYAELACRLNDPVLALNKLKPKIKTFNNKFKKDVTLEQKAVFGYALNKLGATEEAIDVLEQAKEEKKSLLYLSFCYASQWEYGKTVPLLKKYIKSQEDPYWLRISQLNLASAYVFLQQYTEALNILRKLLKESETDNNILLKSNCLELSTQMLYWFE